MVNIQAINIQRVFRDGTRIGPISFKVEEGELLTLLGPSGSGKTTTLRMIAGFIAPADGIIKFNDQEVTSLPPREREIGMVVQSVALFPNMDVFQNIAFALDVRGWERTAIVDRVNELSNLLDISNLLSRYPSEISGGEAQRVALARALSGNPKLLLLDEPFSALDPQLREKLQYELRRIQQELGITTIYVTHSQSEAFAISDRIAVLSDGVVVQSGKPIELYNSPSSEFVAEFIGGGNILSGEVISSQDGMIIIKSNGTTFQVEGSANIGESVKFSFKPEDVVIDENGSIEAVVIRRILDVGYYRLHLKIGRNHAVIYIQDNQIPDCLLGEIPLNIRLSINPGNLLLLPD